MTEAQFGQGVVRCFLVGGKTDGLREIGGNLGAVVGHVANLSVGQPQFEQQIDQQQHSEQQGEIHGRDHG